MFIYIYISSKYSLKPKKYEAKGRKRDGERERGKREKGREAVLVQFTQPPSLSWKKMAVTMTSGRFPL